MLEQLLAGVLAAWFAADVAYSLCLKSGVGS